MQHFGASSSQKELVYFTHPPSSPNDGAVVPLLYLFENITGAGSALQCILVRDPARFHATSFSALLDQPGLNSIS